MPQTVRDCGSTSAVVDSSKKISLPAKLPTTHPPPTNTPFQTPFNLPTHPGTELELSTPQEQPKSACQLNYSFNQIRLLVRLGFGVRRVIQLPHSGLSTCYGYSKEIISNMDVNTQKNEGVISKTNVPLADTKQHRERRLGRTS